MNHQTRPHTGTDTHLLRQTTARILVFLLAACTGLLAAGCALISRPATKQVKHTFSSFDLPSEHVPRDKPIQGTIEFQGTPLTSVLRIYQALSGRTVIHGPLPAVTITFRSQTALNRVETLRQFDTVLAQNGIAMVLSGDNAIKAVTVGQASAESPPEITLPWPLLPDSSSYMSRTVHLQYFKPTEVLPLLQPLSKLPNSIIAVDEQQLLILRDYASNIRQELRLLEELEKKPSH